MQSDELFRGLTGQLPEGIGEARMQSAPAYQQMESVTESWSDEIAEAQMTNLPIFQLESSTLRRPLAKSEAQVVSEKAKTYKEANDIIVDSFKELLPSSLHYILDTMHLRVDAAISPYQPPRVSLFMPDLGTAADLGTVAISIGTAASWLISRFRTSSPRGVAADTSRPNLFFPAPMLLAMCEAYVRSQYHPRARLESKVLGFSTIDTAAISRVEEYIVQVLVGKAARKTYEFRINSLAEISKLTLEEGRRRTSLLPPSWTESGIPLRAAA
jgi:hypothetical protein